MAKKTAKTQSITELDKQYKKELEDYKNQLKDIATDKLNDEESKWLKELEKYDKYIKDRQYSLPKNVVFEGEDINKQRVFTSIRTFLGEKLEIEWKYIQGMYDMCRWYSSMHDNISYAYLDSTLRILDQFKYKGYKEWQNILIVNEYFKQCTAEYQVDCAKLIHLSQMHNAVMEEQQLRAPVNADTTETPELKPEQAPEQIQ